MMKCEVEELAGGGGGVGWGGGAVDLEKLM